MNVLMSYSPLFPFIKCSHLFVKMCHSTYFSCLMIAYLESVFYPKYMTLSHSTGRENSEERHLLPHRCMFVPTAS